MTIRVVTHAWAGRFPQYASFLRYQILSLERCHEELDGGIKLTICYCPDDNKVVEALVLRPTFTFRLWETIPLSSQELGRRCIGRNMAARSSLEDFVFFTDVDHLFTPECFRQIPERFQKGASMIFPGTIKIHRLHSIGDYAATNELSLPTVLLESDFEPKFYNRAIGGVQIVRGGFARKYGYLDGDQGWQQPTETPFGDFRDDLAYRRFCTSHGPIVKVDLDGIYRLRHSRTTYQDKIWTT